MGKGQTCKGKFRQMTLMIVLSNLSSSSLFTFLLHFMFGNFGLIYYLGLSVNHSGVGRGGVMESLDGSVTRQGMAEEGSVGWGDGWMTGGVPDVLGMGIALVDQKERDNFDYLSTLHEFVFYKIHRCTNYFCLDSAFTILLRGLVFFMGVGLFLKFLLVYFFLLE